MASDETLRLVFDEVGNACATVEAEDGVGDEACGARACLRLIAAIRERWLATPMPSVDWRAELRAFRAHVKPPEPCPHPEQCDNYSCDVNSVAAKAFKRVDTLLADQPASKVSRAGSPLEKMADDWLSDWMPSDEHTLENIERLTELLHEVVEACAQAAEACTPGAMTGIWAAAQQEIAEDIRALAAPFTSATTREEAVDACITEPGRTADELTLLRKIASEANAWTLIKASPMSLWKLLEEWRALQVSGVSEEKKT